MTVEEAKGVCKNRSKWKEVISAYRETGEELDGSAVSALGVRSRKLSNVLNGQSWDG
jgi:hypothetical protein